MFAVGYEVSGADITMGYKQIDIYSPGTIVLRDSFGNYYPENRYTTAFNPENSGMIAINSSQFSVDIGYCVQDPATEWDADGIDTIECLNSSVNNFNSSEISNLNSPGVIKVLPNSNGETCSVSGDTLNCSNLTNLANNAKYTLEFRPIGYRTSFFRLDVDIDTSQECNADNLSNLSNCNDDPTGCASAGGNYCDGTCQSGACDSTQVTCSTSGKYVGDNFTCTATCYGSDSGTPTWSPSSVCSGNGDSNCNLGATTESADIRATLAPCGQSAIETVNLD